MHKFQSWIEQKHKLLAILLAILGGLFYLSRSWQYAHTIPSVVWDEGMYIYKGYLFASGRYLPYQDYGPWTNQFPVAYFFPGLVQVLFGLGMQSARIYAVALGVLTLLGLWLTAKRLQGGWWAAGVVWVVALNSGWLKAFSQVFSQGLVSFFFAWMLAFLLGRDRKTWELSLAAILASLAGMTRINVLPVLGLVILFIFWQYGKKAGLWALAAGAFPILSLHWYYWPEILKLWAYWIPPEIFPRILDFRSPWREIFLPDNFSWWRVSEWWNTPNHLAWLGISHFIRGLRANFVSWFSVVLLFIFFPRKGEWQSESARKNTVFLVGTYLVMLFVHIWAAMGGNTCQFTCFVGYFLYFNWFGIFALIASVSSWRKKIHLWPYLTVIILLMLLFVAFEYDWDNNFREVRSYLVYDVLGADVEKMQNEELRSQPETNPFWKYLQDQIGFSRYRWLRFLLYNDFLTRVLWWFLPSFFVAGIPWLSYRLLKRTGWHPANYRKFALMFLWGFGVLFASNPYFSQALDVEACDSNVVKSYETVGKQLQQEIPPGSQVFWDVKTNAVLLYIPDADVFLPQLNHRFTFVGDREADPDTLTRFGWWNESLGQKWIEMADYAVVEYRFYDQYWNWTELIDAGGYDTLLITEPMESCRAGTQLVVLKRVP